MIKRVFKFSSDEYILISRGFFSVFTYYWKGQELSRLIQTYGSVNVKLEKGSHCQSISRGSGPFANFNQTEGVFCQPEVSTPMFSRIFLKVVTCLK